MSQYEYSIGRRRVSQEEHDSEIARLLSTGLKQKEIAVRLKKSERTIQRTVQRLGQKADSAKQEGKEQREFKALQIEDFKELPDLAKWLEGCRARHVSESHISHMISQIKRIAESQQIYPAMLDIPECIKWLAQNSNMTEKQLRHWKNAMRSFLIGTGRRTPIECTNAGIDSQHHGDGDYAKTKLSEEQIAKGIELLKDDPRALAIFRLGTECCCPAQEILEISKSSFVDLNENGDPWLCIKRGKTESDWTKKPRKETIDLWLSLEVKGKDGKFFSDQELYTNNGTDSITTRLKKLYPKIGATDPYFSIEAIHALRHCGAQRLLRKTNWNRTATARLGGWLAEITLEKHYGAMPDEMVREIGNGLWK